MTALSPNYDFQSELEALKSWFSAINQTERMAALCLLVRHADLAKMIVVTETLAGNIEQKRVNLQGAKGSHVRRNKSRGEGKYPSFLCYVTKL